jgi:predicted secreted hydrolase
MRTRGACSWAALAVLTAACVGPHDAGKKGAAVRSLTGIGLLGSADGAGFERALAPRPFEFPRDHGPHPRFRTEWWYYTGNLTGAGGRRFGFELTFFRVALRPEPASGTSQWRANQVWLAHFAVTDAAGRRFVAAQRLARGALGLAGATADPFRVWVEDWSVSGQTHARDASFTLRAVDGDTGLALTLQARKPVVAQGENGLDAKGPERGNASYYYSMPRLVGSGTITIGGVPLEVQGSAWMDREWSTSALSAGVRGWEWFGLQLSDGRDLMFYRLRREDGTATRFSGGALIDATGTPQRLGAQAVQLTPEESWTSPQTGVKYPVSWKLSVPSEDLVLDVVPILPNQELDLTVRYWEGAVDVAGRGRSGALTGRGYLELAGY